ncbi:MAG: hypothetical protein NTX87_06970, partial [Planctomycetota bacterium]|nr:hypothetical protein [Planctomycetota bacterium]
MAEGTADIQAAGEGIPKLFARQEVVELVREALRTEGRASVEGLWGSSAPALAASFLSDCPSTLLYVLAHTDSVDDARDDWRLFAGVDPPVFPAWEALPAESDVSDEILAERLRVLKTLAAARPGDGAAGQETRRGLAPGEYTGGGTAALTGRGDGAAGDKGTGSEKVSGTLRLKVPDTFSDPVPFSPPVPAAVEIAETLPRVLVTTIQALMQPVPSPRHLADNTLELVVGREYSLPHLRQWLAERGFKPAELVLEPGQYAARGGIIDVFGPTAPAPYRLEFFGDTLESLRTFDPGTQRSLDDRDRAAISFLPTGQGGPIAPATTTNLMDYLPPDAWIVWRDPLEIAEVGRSFLAALASPVGVYTFEAVVQRARDFTRLDLSSFTTTGASEAFSLRTEAPPPLSGKAETVREELAEIAREDTLLVFSDNEGERDRLGEILGRKRCQGQKRCQEPYDVKVPDTFSDTF